MRKVFLISVVFLTVLTQGCSNFFESAASSVLTSIYDPYTVKSNVDSAIYNEKINSLGIIIYENEIFGWKFLDSSQIASIENSVKKNIYLTNPYLRVEYSAIKDAVEKNNLKKEYEEFLDNYDDEDEINYKFIKQLGDMADVDCLLVIEIRGILMTPQTYSYVNDELETKPGSTDVNIYSYMYSTNTGKFLWSASVYEEIAHEVYKPDLANELVIPTMDRLFEKFPL
jgi:hypothetical protein